MTTTDHTLIIILSVLLSVFFLLCIAVMVVVLKVLASVRQVVAKAEGVVDSVESAAEIFKDTSGRLALFKVIRNIMKIMKGKK